MEIRDRSQLGGGLSIPEATARAFDRRALATWMVPGAIPLSYREQDGGVSWKAIGAATADPNQTEPPEGAFIIGGGVSHLGILAVCDQAVVLQLYGRTGLTGVDEPAWVKIGAAITVAAGGPEVVLATGYRDLYPMVVSGPDAGHLLDLYCAVA